MTEMFEELYEKLTPQDRDAYLERIGLAGLPLKGDLETLNRVLYAHVHHIPFENLDAWDRGHCPSLAVRDLFDKMILHRRGGWCHELNGLLHPFLESLGYTVYSVGGRVTADLDFITPIGHHGVICVLDGKKYYCDVGFGDIAFQSAIPLDGTPSPFGFHIEKNGDWYDVWRDRGRRMKMLTFADLAYEPVDYLFANYVNAMDPNEHFRHTLYVSIMDGGKRKLLCGSTLTEQGDGPKSLLAEVTDRTQLSALLKEHFNIEYQFSH